VLRQPSGPLSQVFNDGSKCTNYNTTASIAVSASDDSGTIKGVTVTWSGFAKGSRSLSGSGTYTGTIGPITWPGNNNGGTLTISVTATDGTGKSTTIAANSVAVDGCYIIG
jgi:putative peptide zinc metalloprotease protein